MSQSEIGDGDCDIPRATAEQMSEALYRTQPSLEEVEGTRLVFIQRATHKFDECAFLKLESAIACPNIDEFARRSVTTASEGLVIAQSPWTPGHETYPPPNMAFASPRPFLMMPKMFRASLSVSSTERATTSMTSRVLNDGLQIMCQLTCAGIQADRETHCPSSMNGEIGFETGTFERGRNKKAPLSSCVGSLDTRSSKRSRRVLLPPLCSICG